MRRERWHIAMAAVAALALQGGAPAAQAAGAGAQDGAEEERLALPSGLVAGLQEALREEGADGRAVLRFRYVAPAFTRDMPLEEIAADLEHLCNVDALERLPEAGGEGARIVVSLADRAGEFGVIDRDRAQVFEAYRVENGRCIWEVF